MIPDSSLATSGVADEIREEEADREVGIASISIGKMRGEVSVLNEKAGNQQHDGWPPALD